MKKREIGEEKNIDFQLLCVDNRTIQNRRVQMNTKLTIPRECAEQFLIEQFELVAAEVKTEVQDLTTTEGRKRVKELAAKVAKSKMVLDKRLRDYLREIKEYPRVIEKSARDSIARFDTLKVELMEPLETLKAEQTERLAAIKSAAHSALVDEWGTSDQIKAKIADLETVCMLDFFEEDRASAKRAVNAALSAFKTALCERTTSEAKEASRALQEQIELSKAKEREEQLKIEREEALRARFEAERAREEAEKARSVAEAAEAEVRRQEQARLAAEAAETAKQQDKEHRQRVNRAALVSMVGHGYTEEDAKKLLRLVISGHIENVCIKY